MAGTFIGSKNQEFQGSKNMARIASVGGTVSFGISYLLGIRFENIKGTQHGVQSFSQNLSPPSDSLFQVGNMGQLFPVVVDNYPDLTGQTGVNTMGTSFKIGGPGASLTQPNTISILSGQFTTYPLYIGPQNDPNQLTYGNQGPGTFVYPYHSEGGVGIGGTSYGGQFGQGLSLQSQAPVPQGLYTITIHAAPSTYPDGITLNGDSAGQLMVGNTVIASFGNAGVDKLIAAGATPQTIGAYEGTFQARVANLPGKTNAGLFSVVLSGFGLNPVSSTNDQFNGAAFFVSINYLSP